MKASPEYPQLKNNLWWLYIKSRIFESYQGKNSNFELKKKNDSGPQRDLGFLKMYTQGYQSDALKAKRRKLDKIFKKPKEQ